MWESGYIFTNQRANAEYRCIITDFCGGASQVSAQAPASEVIVEERAGPADLRENLTNLGSQSLWVMALFTALISYGVLLIPIWPDSGDHVPPSVWAGGAVLASSVTASFLLGGCSLAISSHVLVLGMLIAVAWGLRAFGSLSVSYLLIVPIVSASALLGQATLVLVTTASYLLIVATLAALPGLGLGAGAHSELPCQRLLIQGTVVTGVKG